jgi:hypothetical protein
MTDSKQKLVVEGIIVDNCEEQVVKVSYTSSTERAKFIGVENCEVQVVDQNNTSYNFERKSGSPGTYIGSIPENILVKDNKFRLTVKTPDGKTYISSYEEMLPCPPVNNVYYLIERRETETPGEFIDGLQFYIDFNASEYYGRFYRWIIEESFEYHSTWTIGQYYDPDNVFNDDRYLFVCYKTEELNGINLLSTEGLTQNKYNKAKLHFVDDHSQRLLFNYSILVKQRSISKQAYLYFNDLKKNNQETDGLFTKQPAMPKGNIFNENDSTEVILGYFSVSSETTKRILIAGAPDLPFQNVGFCKASFSAGPLPPHTLLFFVYDIAPDGSIQRGTTTQECVDCTMHGGVLEKPDFFN